jgi:hypothetical protein
MYERKTRKCTATRQNNMSKRIRSKGHSSAAAAAAGTIHARRWKEGLRQG